MTPWSQSSRKEDVFALSTSTASHSYLDLLEDPGTAVSEALGQSRGLVADVLTKELPLAYLSADTSIREFPLDLSRIKSTGPAGASNHSFQSTVRRTSKTLDRHKEIEWVHEHRTEYAGKWVAVEGKQLVSKGSSARTVYDAAKKQGLDTPFIVYVEEEKDSLFGGW